jgi:hypothetical protein
MQLSQRAAFACKCETLNWPSTWREAKSRARILFLRRVAFGANGPAAPEHRYYIIVIGVGGERERGNCDLVSAKRKCPEDESYLGVGRDFHCPFSLSPLHI